MSPLNQFPECLLVESNIPLQFLLAAGVLRGGGGGPLGHLPFLGRAVRQEDDSGPGGTCDSLIYIQ